jgi:hypothetical protein
VRCGRAASVLSLATAAVVFVSLCGGCAGTKHEEPTGAQARRAFEAMYPGLAALSAEGSGTAWVVRGYGKTDPTMDSTIAVQSTVSSDATGVASALVDGVRWSGSADLGALLESRPDSDGDTWPVVDAVWMSLPDDGTRVVDVQRVPNGRIRVTVVTSEGPPALLFVTWDTDTEQWLVGTPQESEPETSPPAYVDSLPAHRPGRRPTRNEIIAVVKKFAARQNADIALAKVEAIKVARDSRGRWWVSAIAVPVKSHYYDEAILYLYKQGATWRLKDFGTGIDTSELPEDVRSRL